MCTSIIYLLSLITKWLYQREKSIYMDWTKIKWNYNNNTHYQTCPRCYKTMEHGLGTFQMVLLLSWGETSGHIKHFHSALPGFVFQMVFFKFLYFYSASFIFSSRWPDVELLLEAQASALGHQMEAGHILLNPLFLSVFGIPNSNETITQACGSIWANRMPNYNERKLLSKKKIIEYH